VRGLERRAEAIAAAAARFLDPADPLRRRAEEELPSATGFSPQMVREALPRIFGPITAAELVEMAGELRADPVRVVAIVSAGNVPGVALPKTVLALAAGAACLIKAASREPLLPALFAEALADVDPALGRLLAVLWWPGGTAAVERELAAADSLVAYGSDAALGALAAFAPARFVGHGHRLSIACLRLGEDAPIDELARAAALDVALYDQLGCLSPQCLYVEGRPADREKLVERLAVALQELSQSLPRGSVPAEGSTAIRRLRDEYEWREISGEAVRGRASAHGTDWTILVDPDPHFRSSPLYRTVFVRPLESIGSLRESLGRADALVESIGVGPWSEDAARTIASAMHAPRIAPLGRMQSPDLRWRQGGRHPLAGLAASDRS
jgi:acyl-CoA reductase-like NAD-dependent aldehyde dehydrogenase